MMFKQFSLHWFDPNPSQGSELKKIRPCVIVSPDELNDLLNTVIIVPLTSTIKPWPFRVTVRVLDRRSSAACDQLRTVDKSRLKASLGDLNAADGEKVLAMLNTIFTK